MLSFSLNTGLALFLHLTISGPCFEEDKGLGLSIRVSH